MKFNWQQEGWPKATVNRAALRDELKAFGVAFRALKKALGKPQELEIVARALADEAVKTSAIEGLNVDESVVMSSICRALGVTYAPKGFTKDARAEGVAQMVLSIRETWDKPISTALLKRYHKALMAGDGKRISVGAFRSHVEPMRVIRRLADGTVEVRYVAPPSASVPNEMRTFTRMWKSRETNPTDVALKAAMLHPHFESIHPFEDGNGRVGRALVAKALAEGLCLPVILPVSATIMRHRVAYYDEINEASRTLDWTNWAAFFIPVLTEMMTHFVAAMRFVAVKHDYLGRYERDFSARARKVILRMFEDGEEGVKSGLSAAKWMRMAKVSKPTATRDLAELEAQGAIVSEGGGASLRYRLTCCALHEPIEPLNGGAKMMAFKQNKGEHGNRHEPLTTDEPLNEPLNDYVFRLVQTHPGTRLPYLKSVVGKSAATVKRALAELIRAGRIEHRGSKKTGGYYSMGSDPIDEKLLIT